MGRKWGQHFLRSPRTIEKIVEAASLCSNDVVLEIGPGEGVLTLPLCEVAEQVHAFEIDPELAERLKQRGVSNLRVHQMDFLKADSAELPGHREWVVAANLPYYITAPIMERLFWQRPLTVKRAVLMMQEEVARRVSEPASRQAGALTYIAGAFFKVEYLFKVPPGCFAPPPKVDSAVIRLTPRGEPQGLHESARQTYEQLVSTAFRGRRKQLGKSLRALHPEAPDLLAEAGIDPKRRPETLTVQEFWEATRKWPHCE